jgi:hypothetical protein
LEDNIALLIDFENIAAGTEKENLGRFKIDALINRLKDKGRILVARAFGDWGRFARFKQDLLAANVTMMELTSHGMQDKNRADIAMVVDCLELAFTRAYVDTYVVVSGDSDFTPLVLKLRELNKRVIGVGTRGSTSRLIINACDEFIFYDTLIQTRERHVPKATTRKLPKGSSKAMEILLEALEGLQREDPTPPLASVVKTAMLRRRPDFTENDLTFTSFTRFLESAQDAGIVTLHRDKKSGGYRIDAVEETVDDVLEVAPLPERPRPARASAPKKEEAYEDPYFPAGSDAIVAAMLDAKLGPMAAPTRMAALEALCEAVDDRNKKRRRVTIAFVQEDVKKLLRRTHPDLSARAIRDLLTTLMNAGQFIHKDATPIRSANAPFMLSKDASKLNHAYVEYALGRLLATGTDLGNVSVIAELFLGDPARTRDIETILAWLATRGPVEEPGSDGDQEPYESSDEPTNNYDLDRFDLDDLLVSDDTGSDEVKASRPSARSAEADSADDEPRSKRRRRRRKSDREDESPSDDGVTSGDDELPEEPVAAPVAPVEEAAPARKPKAEAKPKRAKAAPKAAEEAAPAAPKPRSRAKKAEPANDGLDDFDALLDIGE